MVQQIRLLRSHTAGKRPTGRVVGEPYINLVDKAFGWIGPNGEPQDAPYARVDAANTLTAPLTIDNQTTTLQGNNANDTAIVFNTPAGVQEGYLRRQSDRMILARRNAGSTKTTLQLLDDDVTLTGLGTGSPTAASILTRARGDERYVNLNSDGNASLFNDLAFTRDGLAYISTPSGRQVYFQQGTTNVARIEGSGTEAPSILSVMTREMGDRRYLNASGGELSGNLTLQSLYAQSGNIYIRAPSNGNAYLWLTDSGGTNRGLLFATAGITYLRNYATNGTSTATQFEMRNDDVRMTGTSGAAQVLDSILDARRGDVRYEKLDTVIHSSGSNSNGEYVRFKDGTMICWNREAYLGYQTTSASLGPYLYRSPGNSRSFPASFVGSGPAISITPTSADGGGTFFSAAVLVSSTSSFTTTIYAAHRDSFNVRIDFIAVGRWK